MKEILHGVRIWEAIERFIRKSVLEVFDQVKHKTGRSAK